MTPVPTGVPLPTFRHFHRDESDQIGKSVYLLDGELLGYVVRFRTSMLNEVAQPYTWCQSEVDGSLKWHWRQFDEPRPLFMATRDMPEAQPGRTVVLVANELTAETLQAELDDAQYCVVSWPGGAKHWRRANWSWLQGCRVLLWPDCDAQHQALTRAEHAAMADDTGRAVLRQEKPLLPLRKQPGWLLLYGVGELLRTQHGCSVAMLPVPEPGTVKPGWNARDAIESDSWPRERLLNFLASAQPRLDAADGGSAPTIAAAGDGPGRGRTEAAATGQRRWQDCLLLTDKGAVKAVRENIVLALDGLPLDGIAGLPETAGLVRYNEFTNNVEKAAPTPWGTPAGPWEEHDELLMGQWLTHVHGLPSVPRSTLEESALMVSRRNAFHPPRQRLLALRGRWDGTPRLNVWLERCCWGDDGEPVSEDDYELGQAQRTRRYMALAGAWFIMGMCARIMPTAKRGVDVVLGPGTKFDFMLVFEGPQYIGKSRLAETLGGEYYADTGLVLGEKDSYQNIQGIQVYEWGELDSLARAEVTKVKSFISSRKDRFRASFDRRPRDYPRQVVFVGTTNERHYLSDPTGNRRFWPVRCARELDIGWLRDNLEQLMAEALHYLDKGVRFWPSAREQRELFEPEQRQRVLESPLESAIRRYLYDEHQKVSQFGQNGALLDKITLTDLLTAVGYTADRQTPAVAKQLAAVMHSLGWELKRASRAGEGDKSRPHYYHRPGGQPNPGPAAGADSQPPAARGVSPRGANDDCPF